MKKITILSIVLAVVLFTGCEEKVKDSAIETVTKTVESTKETADSVKEGVETVTTTVSGADAYAYGKCEGCHGANGKTLALGKSAIIAGQAKEELVTKIKGYRAGTINVAGMGMLMKAQVASMDDATIDAVATYISALK